MKLRLLLMLFLPSLLLMSCHQSKVYDDEISDLDKNEKLWLDHQITNYQINTRVICFCMMTDEITIVVENNEIARAFFTQSGVFLNEQQLEQLLTIEEHFELIREAYSQDADHINVSYDPNFGFPTQIDVDYSYSIADDEFTYTLANLQ